MTVNSNGEVSYAPVYLFGHRDEKSLTNFFRLFTEAGKTLELSAQHYVPVYDSPTDASSTMKRAMEVKVGEYVRTYNDKTNTLDLTRVEKIIVDRKTGLYNPFTKDGKMVVNGVVASEYSEFFLEDVLPDRFIPAVYHAIHSPLANIIAPMFPSLMDALDKRLVDGHSKFFENRD